MNATPTGTTLLIGLNYRTAPVQVRERLAFSREGVATALLLFKQQFPNAEAAILSTCNRVEVLVHSAGEPLTPQHVIAFLSQARDVPQDDFREHLYVIHGTDAVRHLFRVISGLDSMVVGEYQIVNQLKQAYELAHEQGTTGPVLNRLFHHAFGVSKRVRTETSIGEGKTSLPSVAVDFIRRGCMDFAGKRILIIGAGEMARLTAEYLRDGGATELVVTTRTFNNAKALAELCKGAAAPFENLDKEIEKAYIVVTATNSPVALLTRDRVARAQAAREGKPLLLVDLCVPRNVEERVTELPGVRLLDVDALGGVVEENQRQRASQLGLCDAIVAEEVTAFERWAAQSRVRPLIEQMYEDVRALAEIEVRGFYRRCPELTDDQRDAVAQLADRIVAKLMHPCVCTVRQQSETATVLADAFHGTRLQFAARSRCDATAANAN